VRPACACSIAVSKQPAKAFEAALKLSAIGEFGVSESARSTALSATS
jgi:hypothetical protein